MRKNPYLENERKLFCAQVRPYYKEKQLPALINFLSGTGGVTIYYSKEGLERIRKEAEEYLKREKKRPGGINMNWKTERAYSVFIAGMLFFIRVPPC
ncbi:MAG TPA: hypothetical protein DCD97_03110 [Firmicutes bacterium]|nr:hypothetical protein [Bacillota bacterium]